MELFKEEEQNKLIRLTQDDFNLPNILLRKVYHDCHVSVCNNYYSVPYEYVGKVIEIELDINLIKLLYNGKQIALHPRHEGKGKFITTESHYPQHKIYSPNSEEYRSHYYDKLKEIGDNAGKLFKLLVKKHPYNWYNMAKGILSLQKTYPKGVIDLACQRALSFDISTYSKIRDICKSGSYNLPIESCREEVLL